MSCEPPTCLFREEQRFLPRWLAVTTLGICAAGAIYGVASGAWRGLELLGLVVLLLIAVLFSVLELIVEVLEERIQIRFRPFMRCEIRFDEISGCEARSYRPIREFGGWGIRMRPGKRAYSVRGTRGAELTLEGGRKILIGSARAQELAQAIQAKLR